MHNQTDLMSSNSLEIESLFIIKKNRNFIYGFDNNFMSFTSLKMMFFFFFKWCNVEYILKYV